MDREKVDPDEVLDEALEDACTAYRNGGQLCIELATLLAADQTRRQRHLQEQTIGRALTMVMEMQGRLMGLASTFGGHAPPAPDEDLAGVTAAPTSAPPLALSKEEVEALWRSRP